MNEQESNHQVDANNFADEMTDEALDRDAVNHAASQQVACQCFVCYER